MEYFGRPWGGILDSFNFMIAAQITETTETRDRCVHTIIKQEEPDQLLTILFDWQRTFNTGWQITKSNLERVTNDAQKDALKYFEDLAEGSRFDEVLIRKADGV